MHGNERKGGMEGRKGEGKGRREKREGASKRGKIERKERGTGS